MPYFAPPPPPPPKKKELRKGSRKFFSRRLDLLPPPPLSRPTSQMVLAPLIYYIDCSTYFAEVFSLSAPRHSGRPIIVHCYCSPPPPPAPPPPRSSRPVHPFPSPHYQYNTFCCSQPFDVLFIFNSVYMYFSPPKKSYRKSSGVWKKQITPCRRRTRRSARG